MRTTVRKWGNSLALRIPSGLAEDAHLRDGVEADVVEGGRRVVARAAAPDVSLETLLAGITPENVHGEQHAGRARGTEVW
ncbi:multidrug transporter MatE [Gemmatimonadetes bacterium T265]|nr:multidrug transporter MatE [Gemmatimonadetes bacterium T265]